MKLKEFNIVLDIKKRIDSPSIEVVQGDNETNILNIKLKNGNKDYQIGNNHVEVAFKKPDGGVVIQEDATIDANKIRYVLSLNTIDIPGKVLGEVRIKNETSLLTSSQFSFYVRQSIR